MEVVKKKNKKKDIPEKQKDETNKGDASDASNGFSYQRLYTILLILDNYDNNEIEYIQEEGNEDIELIKTNGKKDVYQLKYHNSDENETLLNNNKCGLYKTLTRRENIFDIDIIDNIYYISYSKNKNTFIKNILEMFEQKRYEYLAKYIIMLCSKNSTGIEIDTSVCNNKIMEKFNDNEEKIIDYIITNLYDNKCMFNCGCCFMYDWNKNFCDNYISKFKLQNGMSYEDLVDKIKNKIEKIFKINNDDDKIMICMKFYWELMNNMFIGNKKMLFSELKHKIEEYSNIEYNDIQYDEKLMYYLRLLLDKKVQNPVKSILLDEYIKLSNSITSNDDNFNKFYKYIIVYGMNILDNICDNTGDKLKIIKVHVIKSMFKYAIDNYRNYDDFISLINIIQHVKDIKGSHEKYVNYAGINKLTKRMPKLKPINDGLIKKLKETIEINDYNIKNGTNSDSVICHNSTSRLISRHTQIINTISGICGYLTKKLTKIIEQKNIDVLKCNNQKLCSNSQHKLIIDTINDLCKYLDDYVIQSQNIKINTTKNNMTKTNNDKFLDV